MSEAHEVIQNASAWVKRFALLIPQDGLVLGLACGFGRHAMPLAGMGLPSIGG